MKRIWIHLRAGVFVLAVSGSLLAQDEQNEIETLRKRVEKLEQDQAGGDLMVPADDKSLLSKLGSALTFYGFLRVDMVYDDSEPDNTQTTTRAAAEGSGGADNDDSDFSLYTRLTRLGMNFAGGTLESAESAKLTGKLEFDFYGGGSDSRNLIRLRKAYARLTWEHWMLQAGQDSDLFSPLYPSVNSDMLMWNAGNPGDRRPQIRGGYTGTVAKGEYTLLGALAMQGAVDAQDSDGDGILDGEDSGVPQLQMRGGYKQPFLWENTNIEVGVWAVRGKEETDTPIAGTDDFDVSLVGIDFMIPLYQDRFTLKGEIWSGENLDDLRGGIGQGINGTTAREIESKGWWFEVGWKTSDTVNLFAGFSRDDPKDSDLPATGIEENGALWFGGNCRAWDPVIFGAELVHYETEYAGSPGDGDLNRIRIYISYNF